jgi:protein disulfide-isomerase
MDAMATDSHYAEAGQITAIASKLKAMQALDPAEGIPAPLVAAANERIEATLARTHDEHARPAIVNASLDLLDVLGEDDRAYSILSKAPYYYMLDLASLEEKRGHKDAAVALLGRAYRESQGTATRFQWGTVYVRGLVRMRPQGETEIRDAALAVLGELDGPDRIYRRSRIGLEKLDDSLREWDKKSAHAGVITVLRKRMDEVCGKIPTADPARQPCETFLAKA